MDGRIDAEGLGTPEFAERFRARLSEELAGLSGKSAQELVHERQAKYRAIGRADG